MRGRTHVGDGLLPRVRAVPRVHRLRQRLPLRRAAQPRAGRVSDSSTGHSPLILMGSQPWLGKQVNPLVMNPVNLQSCQISASGYAMRVREQGVHLYL